MKSPSKSIQRNLSVITMLTIYVITVMIHLFIDSFILANQIEIIITMLPFIVLGFMLDYIIHQNQTLETGFKLLAQLMPTAIFGMQLISTFLVMLEKDPVELFNYLLWLLIALPFFIGSYRKDNHQQKLRYSVIGAVAITAVYLFLTTQSDNLSEGSGAILFFITYFLALYAASGIPKLGILGTLIGLINAVILFVLRYSPFTEASTGHGWDYDISLTFEMILLLTLMVCILLCFIEALLRSRTA